MYIYKYKDYYFLKNKKSDLGFVSIKTLCDISQLTFNNFKRKINKFTFHINSSNEICFMRLKDAQNVINFVESLIIMNKLIDK